MPNPKPRPHADSPFIKWNGQGRTVLAKKPKPAPAKHDGLCVIQSGLSSCYCRCSQCWDKYGRHCICYDCSCKRSNPWAASS